MSVFLSRHKYLFILALIFLGSIVLSNARGDFPLNDDWTYSWSVQKLLTENVLLLGDWPAMTLATHLVWGLIFTKLFGFSFAVLRISTVVSALVGLFFLFQLSAKISGKKSLAFLLCLVLAINPLYFNLVNSFMTDVNFCTLLIISVYVSWKFFESPSFPLLILVLLLSIALVLLRQYGIIFPLVFFFTSLFLEKNKVLYVVASIVIVILTYCIYQLYESYLRQTLSAGAAYKYSDVISPMDKQFWINLSAGLAGRYRILLIHSLFYTAGFTIAFLPGILKNRRLSVQALLITAVTAMVAVLFVGYPLQVGNVLSNVAIGPDTTYTTLNGYYGGHPHFYSQAFENLLNGLKLVFLCLSLVVLVNVLLPYLKWGKLSVHRGFLFLISLFASYLVMLLETDTFFDRYQLPVILFSLLILAFLLRNYSFSFWYAGLPILFWWYVSVAGTHDYFSWNRLKWQAYEELKVEVHVQVSKIHGGFEIMCWEGGAQRFYKEFDKATPFDYVIQFDEIDSFGVAKKYPFKRYLLPGSDTLLVLKRVKFAKNSATETQLDQGLK